VCVFLTAKNKNFIIIKEYDIGTNDIKLTTKSSTSSIHPSRKKKHKSGGAYRLAKTTLIAIGDYN